jgi:esterase/lipase superfamily enzyme
MNKEKLPVTHMELVRDAYQTGAMKIFNIDAWFKRTAHLKDKEVFHSTYYRYVATEVIVTF